MVAAGGIIPARAGFTSGYLTDVRRSRDHPRSRGVYSTSITRMGDSGGSSPLARGLPGGAGVSISARGIIPARAGFTTHVRPIVSAVGDHPRSRGVYRRYV